MSTPFGGFTQIGVGPTPVQVCPPLGKGMSVTIYNQDSVNVVTLGTSNSLAIGATDGAPLQPLTPGTFPASKAIYAVAPAGTQPLVIIPEGGTLSPSPAQIAAQMLAAGLATEAQQVAQATTIPTGIQQMGAPPYVPNMAFYAFDNMTAAGSPYTINTFTFNSRLWYLSLSLSVATLAAYSSGLVGVTCVVNLASNPIAICQIAIGNPGQNGQDHAEVSYGGVPITGGQSITVNVNNGTVLPNAFIRAGISFMASTP